MFNGKMLNGKTFAVDKIPQKPMKVSPSNDLLYKIIILKYAEQYIQCTHVHNHEDTYVHTYMQTYSVCMSKL